jgi:NAD+ kinase
MQVTSQFKTVALVGRNNTPGIRDPLTALATCIAKRGFEVVFEADTAAEIGVTDYPALRPAEIGARADVAVVLGGDGTMLGIGRQLAPYRTPLIGINHGRLGFITDIPISDMSVTVPQMLAGNFEREERVLLEARIMRQGNPIYHALAFNDVVVNRSGFSGMAELHVSVDGRFMYNQRSDGLIVATPTGSTAYSLSARGPIVSPKHRAMLLTPVSPHMLFDRTLVLEPSETVEIEVDGFRLAALAVDGQRVATLADGDVVTCRPAAETARFIRLSPHHFHHILKSKFGLADR